MSSQNVPAAMILLVALSVGPRTGAAAGLGFFGMFASPYTCSDTMLNAKKQFGCVADGLTDDSHCLQAAIDAAIACGGKALFLPVGTYRITRSLHVSGHMQLLGEGASGSCHGLDP